MQLVRRHGSFLTVLALAAGAAIWLWVFGGASSLARAAAEQQRDVQGALAGALRAVRAGEAWAWVSLLGLCFAYGFFHAAGPGHGKLLMGGYALGKDVPRRRLIGLTLAGSLGQAVTAILLVALGSFAFGFGRAQLTDLADVTLAAFSATAIALVGLWLLFRGLRRFRQVGLASYSHDHAHDHEHNHSHSHDHVCESCGHAHGPTPDQVRQANTWADAVAVVAAIAIRPCTGAIFVLILTFGMGIPVAGIAGALMMGMGTAILTLAVALGAGWLRGGLADRLSGPEGLRAMAAVEIAAGALVALVAGQIALRLF